MTDINFSGSSAEVGFQGTAKNNVVSESKPSAAKPADTVKKESETAKSDTFLGEAAVYEKEDKPAKNSIYTISKMNAEDRAALVSKLKAENEARVNQLFEIVNQMLSKQAGVFKLADVFSPENLSQVSMKDIMQAKEDISEDGYWGVKQTSQRLFDFASALAGDDVNKMKEMQEAMLKGYKQAEKTWGGELPSISQETLAAANKLFDDYYASMGVN
ncbi:MAG: hypothetical protein MJ107_06365 [Lachnospiraceae bacterium]|nr:hypothetical protein [Lachnospiraceae bacterium]